MSSKRYPEEFKIEAVKQVSFFQLLKREGIRRKIYMDREEARRDVFDYIEMFYNPKRRHGYANRLSPVEFEKQYFNRLESI
jgi:putative transposase